MDHRPTSTPLIAKYKKLNDALSLPKFILKYKFGTSNRELRDFDTIVKRYHERLDAAKGVTFKASRKMKIPPLKDKPYIITRLQMEHKNCSIKR